MSEDSNEAPEQQAPEQTTEQTTQEAPSPKESFREHLSDEYKNLYPEFKSMDDFVKGYDNLYRKLGSTIPIPKDGDPESWEKIYNRLGRPEDPQKYEVKPPEDLQFDNEFVDKFKQKAWESGLSDNQAKNLFKWYENEVRGYDKKGEEQVQHAIAELKNKWGASYEDRLEKAQKFANSLINTSDEKTTEKIQKFGNDPDFIDLMYNLNAKYNNEHKLVRSDSHVEGPSDYKEKARELINSKDYATNVDKQRRVQNIYKLIAEQQAREKE